MPGPRSRLPNPAEEFLVDYVRRGTTPFFGLPLVDGSDPRGARVVFLGVPYDGGSSHDGGQRYAPYSVRRASVFAIKVEAMGWLTGGKAVDGGNLPAPMRNPAGMREVVEAGVAAVLAAGAAPFTVGGDHSITLPILRAMARKHGPVAVVHIDAHPDTAMGAEFFCDDDFHHGAPFRHALEEGLIARGQLHQIGVRVGHDEEVTRAHDVKVHDMDEVTDRGVAEVMAGVKAAIGARPTYLTFDIDAVDPAFAPGTGSPVPGGLSSREALRAVRLLAGLRLCGMDVVEVVPGLDHADLTSLLAASLLMEGLVAFGA
jgi:agmatinase